jgi:hypothetical protein
MNFNDVARRYDQDVEFRVFVEAIYKVICDLRLTPDAAMLASMKFERNYPRPYFFGSNNNFRETYHVD